MPCKPRKEGVKAKAKESDKRGQQGSRAAGHLRETALLKGKRQLQDHWVCESRNRCTKHSPLKKNLFFYCARGPVSAILYEIMPGKRVVRESGDGIGACVEVESSLKVGEDARGGRYFVAATSLPAGDNIVYGHLMNHVYTFVVGRLLSCFIPFILNFI